MELRQAALTIKLLHIFAQVVSENCLGALHKSNVVEVRVHYHKFKLSHLR